MDFTTIIIGLIVIGSFAVPVFLLERQKANKEKVFVKNFYKKAKAQGVEVSEFEKWGNYILGIDALSNRIYYVNGATEIVFALENIRICEKSVVKRKVKTKSGNNDFIDKLSLTFFEFGNEKPTYKLDFFIAEDKSLTNEIAIMEKWYIIIEKALKNSRIKKAV